MAFSQGISFTITADTTRVRRELGLVEKQWQFVSNTLSALASSASEATSQARDSLVIEQISVQADLERLRSTLAALTGAGHATGSP